MSENDKFVVVWEVTCLASKDMIRENKFLVIDHGNDPNFECECCSSNSNHLPPEYSSAEIQTERIKRWQHYRILVGRISLNNLKELAKKDARGWNHYCHY